MKKHIPLLSLLLLLLSACAFDLVSVNQQPASLDSNSDPAADFTLGEEVRFKLGTGYNRKLNEGTRWSFEGSLSQGDVFKTKDQILTVEGSNIFEAYIVVMSDDLVGFYLPVEKTFSPLNKPLKLNIIQ